MGIMSKFEAGMRGLVEGTFGRLIRTKTDTGIVVVLDNRILAKQYGRAFLESLPKCPVEVV